ncbi:protein dachsous [Chelonus insularis]|uniref:protein dachsous n=1 Tax=Chelonus insularis TaxID=460826 RepID=UPI001589A181|nr:protein dachsous [Chelonus insularis]
MEKGTKVNKRKKGSEKLQSSSFLLLILGSAIMISWLNPVKSENVLHFEVSENIPAGSTIGFIDMESPPYLIVPVPGSPVKTDLIVDSTTGEIRTRVSLDRETTPSYSFVVLPPNSRVVINVLDENDNIPTFPVKHVEVEFPENSPRDAKRALPPAKDLDVGQYSTQRYEIISGNYDDVFKLSQHRGRDGVLYLDLQNFGYLDREVRSSYDLVVEASDGGLPPLRSRLHVSVFVQDVNDNPPIFNQTRYTASVPENTTVGTPIITVNATDADIGENGKIEYSINRRQSDKEELFQIHAESGVVYVNKVLDFERKERHELVIVAKDMGAQPLEASVFLTIYVKDVNDNQPTITVIFLSDDATPKISESAQPGEFIARISVSDPDLRTEYSNATVTLFGGDGRFGLATRDNIIYLVVIERPLDREEKPTYDLSVEATDAGTPPLRAVRKFQLLVTDVNDNTPIFEHDYYEAHILEASEPGTSVLTVKATDADDGLNAVIKYSLKNSTWFTINEDTGLISSVTHVDCETNPTPILVVIATDSGRPALSGSATVKVTVHDLNDNEPIFEKPLYNVSVLEDLPVGRCFLKVQATDPDCGVNSMVNYTLGIGQQLVNEQLFVRSDTGEICVRSPLDRETLPFLELSVIATDRGGLSTTAIIRVQVIDVNDNRPIFNPQNYNVTIRQDISPSSTILKVFSKDFDQGLFGQVIYRISSGNDGGEFRIDRITGELQIIRPNHLARSTLYLLNITATNADGIRNNIDAHIRVSVSANQRIPTCEHPRYTISVKENNLKNSVIGTIKHTVEDVISGKQNRFFLATGDVEFTIDPILGILRSKISFDRELQDKYVLSVGVKNDRGIGYCQVEVTVEDQNDNPPTFPNINVKISVPESYPLHMPLYIAHAIDPDSVPSTPIYYILNQNNNDLFRIDVRLGELYLSRKLDYECQQRHSLSISALDGGGLSVNMSLNIEVQDVNDNPPVFERNEYHVDVSENAQINSQIIQVTALDLDTGNNARISYRLLNSTIFRISPNTGWIYLTQFLDRETIDHYVLSVIASDNGNPASTASCLVYVMVLDENDNSPHFEKEFYIFELAENLPPGTLVGSVSAFDPDLDVNALLKYAIVQHNSSFTIDPDTGEITTREPLDREMKSVYELVLEVKDRGIPSKTSRVSLRITVLDVNDNSPIIVDPQGDVVSVREEQVPGTEVAKVRAIDPDLDENSTITYTILRDLDSNESGVFSIDPITGIIRTKLVLDHEERDVYRVSVKAMDAGQPPRHSIRTWRVEVLALADNRPTFRSSSLTFHVREDATIGHTVGSVISTGSAGRLTYSVNFLTPSTTNPIFDVHRSSGELVVAHALDRENISEYYLEVRALDTTSIGNPQSIAVSVKIIIDDFNDNPPKWSLDPIVIKIPENTEIGSIIYNFTATDLDSGLNGDIRYELIYEFPSSGSFAIDSVTGALTVTKLIDREEKSEYILSIKASDCAALSERLSSTVTAKIIILDENDNDPVFVAPEVTKISITPDLVPGTNIVKVIAVDKDDGKNGRVSYIIASDSEASKFSVGYDTGIITLTKSIVKDTILQIIANDHGTPSRRAVMNITLTIATDQIINVPRVMMTHSVVDIPQDFSVGGLITDLVASTRHTHENITFRIPTGIHDDKFGVSSTGIVTLRKALNNKILTSYHIPVIAESNNLFDVTILEVNVQKKNSPKFLPGSCYTLAIPENQENSIVHTFATFGVDTESNDIQYSIIGGNIGEKFKLDSTTGQLYASSLDRETTSRYLLSISAKNKKLPSLEDYCNITVIVLDVNDNSPMFLRNQNTNDHHSEYRDTEYFNGQLYSQFSSSFVYPRYNSDKYTVSISEDIPPDSSIMTLKATDPDQGINGKITYALAEESTWLFKIDNFTGIITTAGSLDRELQNTYNFMVTATDGSNYDAKSTSIAIEIILVDVNDNAPIFEKTPFTTTIPVTTQPGQVILQVNAKDLDDGINGEIVYSFLHEQEKPKFRIHPNTGIVTTTTILNQEYGKVFYLEVLAKDKGNPSKNTTGLIRIFIDSLDEITPILKFQNNTYEVMIQENAAVGIEIIQVLAVRSDGRRQHISYSIEPNDSSQTFTIDPDTGIVKVNNPSNLDAELNIESTLFENKNESVNKNVQSSEEFDNVEKRDQIGNQGRSKRVLTLVAKTVELEPLIAYAKLVIYIADVNDNPPIFTQPQYSAIALEGNAKGDFILKLSASDIDQGLNGKLLYHIVDGNPDNAFTINPPYSGIVRTNIVLDREIKEEYRLTIIATDQGNPQLTGTTTLSIRVIDVNDNQPTFPGHNTISIAEDTAVGTVISTITANDVDSSPHLLYRLNYNNKSIPFTIDRYSGKITLKQNLNAEECRQYTFQVIASDGIHEAMTDVTVKILDVNDNPPKFTQAAHFVTLSENHKDVTDIITVSATDDDLQEENKLIRYYLLRPIKGFSINSDTGVVTVNRTALQRPLPKEIELVVVAEDSGKPPLSSTSLVIVKLNSLKNLSNNREFKVQIDENVIRGTSILKLSDLEMSNALILSQEDDNCFEVSNGNLIVVRNLDRELKDRYILHLGTKRFNSSEESGDSQILITVTVNDINDNYPRFTQEIYELSVKEDILPGTVLITTEAIDEDLAGTPASTIFYNITSGNDAGLFQLNHTSGVISVHSALDCDLSPETYILIILACDSDISTPLCTLTRVYIHLEDVNDNSPRFPVLEYFEFVGENEPAGTQVFTAHASDLDRGVFSKLNYSIVSAVAREFSDIDDSWKLFSVDPKNGIVTTSAVFDYEQRNRYAFTLKATDTGGRSAAVRVRIEIDSRDEFYPQFTEKMYRFDIQDAQMVPGTVIGQVKATDRDKGSDGRVVYQLSSQHPYFKLNRTTGVLIVKKKFSLNDIEPIVKLVVSASSGKQESFSNSTVIEIRITTDEAKDFYASSGFGAHPNHKDNMAVTANKGLADWALGLLIALVLLLIIFGTIFLYLYFKNRKNKKPTLKSGLNDENAAISNNYVNPNAFDTIPIRNVSGIGVSDNGQNHRNSDNSSSCQFAPPKYDEIPPYGPSAQSINHQATSELSGSDRSGSSGRGSAEDDGEDEEIRMINEGQASRDSVSDISVHNTQEYLARLGIVDAPLSNPRRSIENLPLDSIHLFGDEAVTEAEIATLIYGKIDNPQKSGFEVEVPGDPSMNGSLSSIVHSEEELTGSYNWDYLLDWGPQYQPLAHVFSEIARLKDDTTTVQNNNNFSSNSRHKPVHKVPPPPLLTSIAPRSLAVPILGRGILPRSPISHDASAFPAAALSPSFSPSLSPLATRSPSISPLVPPTPQRSQNPTRNLTSVDNELKI